MFFCPVFSSAYVANIDHFATFSSRGSVIGEGVGRSGGRRGAVETASTSAEAATATESASESAATCKSSTAAEASAEAATHSTAEAATATKSRASSSSKAVFADFDHASLPVVAIELLDSIASIVGAFKNNNTGALRSAVGARVDIGSDDTTIAGYFKVSLSRKGVTPAVWCC